MAPIGIPGLYSNLFTNLLNLEVMITDKLKKSIIGIVAALLSVLLFTGVLTPEQAETANEATVGLLENIGAVLTGLFALWGVFTGGKK